MSNSKQANNGRVSNVHIGQPHLGPTGERVSAGVRAVHAACLLLASLVVVTCGGGSTGATPTSGIGAATTTEGFFSSAGAAETTATLDPRSVGTTLHNAEEALAWVHALYDLAAPERERPAYVVGVQLGTLGEVRAHGAWTMTYDQRLDGALSMPVWLIEVEHIDFGHSCPEGANPAACGWENLIIVLNAVTGEEIGYLNPDAEVPALSDAAQLGSIEQAMQRAHELVAGQAGQPARIVSVALLPVDDTALAASTPTTSASGWQVEFIDVGQVVGVCPDGEPCASAHVTLALDPMTGDPLGIAADGPTSAAALPPWPTPRSATPDPSTLEVPPGLAGSDVQALALNIVRDRLGADNAIVATVDLTTPRQAFFKLQDRGVMDEPTWDDALMDTTVWWVELAGDEFQPPDCPDCPAAPKAYLGLLPDGTVLWLVTEYPPLPWFLPAHAIALPVDAALPTARDATASAMRLAATQFEGQAMRFVGATLVTGREALEAQQRAAGTTMPIADPATLDEPVWLVELEGSFHAAGCVACPTGTIALLTLRAQDAALAWAAIGSANAHYTEGLTQVPGEQLVPDPTTPVP